MTRERRVRPGGELARARSASARRRGSRTRSAVPRRPRSRASRHRRACRGSARRTTSRGSSRTTACWRWCSTIERVERRLLGSVAEPEHAREVRRAPRDRSGNVCVWCSSTSCRRCSTVRSHMYAVSSARASDVRDVAARRELLERFERRSANGSTDRARPCTSCSSCTANSMSRIPPGPRFTSRSDRPLLRSISSVRAFIARDFAHRVGVERRRATRTASARAMNASPERRVDPATGSALMSACSSQFCAQRSQYASKASSVRLSAPERPSGRSSASVRNTMPSGGRPAHRREHGARGALGFGLIAVVHEHHVDVARVVELVRRRACPCRSLRARRAGAATSTATSRHACARSESSPPTSRRSAIAEQVAAGDAHDAAAASTAAARAPGRRRRAARALDPRSRPVASQRRRCAASATATGSRSSAANSDVDAVTTAISASPQQLVVASSSREPRMRLEQRARRARARSGSADRSSASRNAGRVSIVSVMGGLMPASRRRGAGRAARRRTRRRILG